MSNSNQPPNWDNVPSGPGGPPQQQPWGTGPDQPPQQQPWGQGQPQQQPWGQSQPQQAWGSGLGQPQQQQAWGPGPGQAPYPAHPQEAPAKRKSKAPLVIAGALALALVVGGVAFAMTFLRGATPAAAEGIPANALAVLEVNLNPSMSDKLAVKDFAEKFPALSDDVDDVDGDYKKAVYQALFSDSDDAPSYSEVEPWLGDSLAVAALPAAEQDSFSGFDPDVLVSIQVTDRDKAAAFVAEHGDGAQVSFIDDLMLVTQEGQPAPDADAIKDAPLSKSEDYEADMAKLGGSWLATGWVGSELVQELVSEGSMSTGLDTTAPNARAAMGLKVEDGSAVVRTVSWSDEPFAAGPATSFLETLPSASLGALSFSLSDSVHDLLWEQLEPMVAQNPQLGDQLGITSEDDLKAILGSEMAVAVGLDGNSQPVIGVKVRTDDPAKHEAFLDTLGSEMGLGGLEHVADGDVVTTTFGQSATDFGHPQKTLGDNETAQDLTSGSGEQQAQIWVDVPAILALPELGLDQDDEMVQNLEPISGVGVSSSALEDNYTETLLRVGTK